MTPIGTLRGITRFPVKSMAGELLQRVSLTQDGLAGDRAYAFESNNAPAGMLRLTGQQRRSMLQFHGWTDTDGSVQVTTPSGDTYPVHSRELPRHFALPGSYRLTHESTPQTDVRPISMHALSDMAALSRSFGAHVDPRRFRSNLAFALNAPVASGCLIRIGSTVQLELLESIPRCRFVTYDPASPVAEEPLFPLMRHLDRYREGRVGIYARVRTPGDIRVGDVVSLLSPPASNTP